MTEKTNKAQSRISSALKKASPVLDIIIPILILLFGVGAVLYYIIGASKYYMTSDSVDSLYWAKASFDSGKLISDNFNYAAILPFGGNLLFYPFIAIFGFGIKAQIAGLTVFALILAAAMYYMATGVGLGRYASASLVSITFFIMSSSAKLREIMWEHVFYYNLGILFFCIGIGLVSRILKYKPKEKLDISAKDGKMKLLGALIFGAATILAVIFAVISMRSVVLLYLSLGIIFIAAIIYIVTVILLKKDFEYAAHCVRIGALALFSVLAATDGLQTLVCFSLPVFAGIFLEHLFDTETPVFSKKNLAPLGIMALILAATGIGYLLIERVTGGVTAGYADAYSTYSDMSGWVYNFLGFFRDWFSLIGVYAADGDPLVSAESILNIIRIFGSLILLAVPFIMLFFYKNIKSEAIKITLWAHFAVSAFIIFAVTFGRLGGVNWRLTPMLGTSVLVSIISAFELIRQKKGMAIRIGTLLLCLLIVLAVPSFNVISKMDTPDENIAWHIAADELEARGLKYGYANFWFSGVISMLSDNNVQVSSIHEDQKHPIAYQYQTDKNAFADKDDAKNYFLLLTEDENYKMSVWLMLEEEKGTIADSFTIKTPGYDERGHVGEIFYVYVFHDNIFETSADGSVDLR